MTAEGQQRPATYRKVTAADNLQESLREGVLWAFFVVFRLTYHDKFCVATFTAGVVEHHPS